MHCSSLQRLLVLSTLIGAGFFADPSRAAAQSFVDATQEAGLPVDRQPAFGNPLFGDMNNDGLLDLFLSRHYNGYALFANNGNGTFREARVLQYTDPNNFDLHAGAMADFNNDGLLDLFIGYGGAGGDNLGRKRDQLYINRGNQLPQEVAGFLGVTNTQGRVQCVSVADLDNDGYLDVFVINRASPNLFWLNNGDGTVTDIAVDLGLDDTPTFFNPNGTLGEFCGWADFDLDGDMDLLMTRFGLKLFRNNGGNSFTNVTATVGLATNAGQEAHAWGDYNNDGRPDLFLCGTRNNVSSSRLYRSNEDGTFTDVTATAGVNSNIYSDARGCAWGDYDNDGDLDLYIVSNDIDLRVNGLDILYRNNGDGTFTDVAVAEGLTVPATGRGEGCAWGDYNNDGALDLIVTNGGLLSEEVFPEGRDVLYRNLGNSNNWLKVIPEGTISNRSGIGTKVWVTTGTRLQFRELSDGAQGKFRTQGLVPLHFGLGSSTQVDLLRIEWPNGLVETYENLAINQTHRLIEGDAP